MKNLILTVLFILLIGFITPLSAQVGINTTGADPDSSAMLDISSTDKGALLPRMSDVQRDAIPNPATGLTVFVTTDSSYYYFDGTAWTRMQSQPGKAFIAQNAGVPDSVLYTSPLSSNLIPLGLEVIGSYAYSFSWAFQQNVEYDEYDISNPAAISAVNFIGGGPQISSGPVIMDAHASTVALLFGTQFVTYDVSDPTNPQGDQTNHFVSQPTGISVYNDDIAAVYSEITGGFELVKFTTPTARKTVSVGSIPNFGPQDVAFRGSYAFVANNANDKLEIIDFSVFNQASVVHTVSLGSDPVSVSISGNYAYVANDGNDKLEIIDISDPLTASLVHSVDLASSPTKVRTNDHYAFVLDDGNDLFQTIDISDPEAASVVGTLSIGSNTQLFDIEGSYAFLLDYNGGTGSGEIQVISIPTDNRFFPLYDLDGKLIGYNNGSALSQKIDRFSLNGNLLELSISGDEEDPKSVDLSGYLDNTDAQSLSLNNNSLSLTNGGSVNLDAYANDNTTLIQDADNDTKIQVEESPDEDVIRFSTGGNQAFTMVENRLEFHNTEESVLIGDSAGVSGTDLSVAIGNNAAQATTSNYNVAIGSGAMQNNVGGRNVAVGFRALQTDQRGGSNIAIGSSSMRDLSGIANNNVAIGLGTLEFGSGDDNVYMGWRTGRNNSGSGNVFLGYRSGQLADGSGNVFLGNSAGYDFNGNNRLIIENSDADSTQALIFGEFDNDKLTINGTLRVNDGTQQNGYIAVSDADGTMTWTDPGTILAGDGDWTVNGNDIYNSNSGNVGIGTTTPAAELDVNGELRISRLQSHGFTTGSNVIQVQATADTDQWIRFRRGGNPRGETGVIFSEFDNDHFFVNNVEDALAFSRSTENSATPDFANSNELMRLAANGNLGIGNNNPSAKLDVAGSIRMQDGNQAAGFIPVSDSNGTMIWTDPGIISGDTLTIIADADGDTKIQVEESADEDVIRFDVAGSEVATLDGNGRLQFFSNNYSVFIGEGAGSIGTDNTYVGNNAAHSVTGGKENTALGSGAMYYKQTGRGNTAIGAWSLLDNVRGHENTAIGSRAGQNATGSGNVFIGYGAGFYASGNNKLYIGNDLYTSLTPLIYGEFDNDLVRVNGSFEAIDNIASNGSYVATIENTANAGWSNGLAIKAGQNTQTVNNRFISFARPDGSEIGAVRQITSNSVDYNTTSDIRLKTNIPTDHQRPDRPDADRGEGLPLQGRPESSADGLHRPAGVCALPECRYPGWR
jgi:hypothetical protein